MTRPVRRQQRCFISVDEGPASGRYPPQKERAPTRADGHMIGPDTRPLGYPRRLSMAVSEVSMRTRSIAILAAFFGLSTVTVASGQVKPRPNPTTPARRPRESASGTAWRALFSRWATTTGSNLSSTNRAGDEIGIVLAAVPTLEADFVIHDKDGGPIWNADQARKGETGSRLPLRGHRGRLRISGRGDNLTDKSHAEHPAARPVEGEHRSGAERRH